MNRKIVLASVVGNALEFFDFTLYGVFSGVIAQLYFPSSNPTTSLLMSLGAFGVGFLMRPFGALVFGYIGDHFGRKTALSFSVLMMGVPTLTMGSLPGYEILGVTASFIVVACRLLQGLCTGGEYNGAAIFSLEHTFGHRPGFVGGLITASCVIGAFLATLLGALTQRSGMPEWAWRVPFFLGAFVSIAGYYIRKSLPETPSFQKAHPSSPLKNLALEPQSPDLFHNTTKNNKFFKNWLNVLIQYWKPSLLTFSFGAFNGTLSYTLFGFLNIYLSRYSGVSLSEAMALNLYGLFAFMVGSPLLGMVFDLSRRRFFLQGVTLGVFLLAVPIFLCFLSNGHLVRVFGQILLGLCTAAIAGTGHGAMQELFPVKARYRGISFFFSLGMALLGGGIPVLYIYGIEQIPMAGLLFPAGVLMVLSLLFGIVIYKFFPKDQRESPLHTSQVSQLAPVSRTGTES